MRKTMNTLKLTSFLILLLAPACYGAAEEVASTPSSRPFNILQAIMCTAVGQTEPSQSAKIDFPKNLVQLVCQYAERKRIVTPIVIICINLEGTVENPEVINVDCSAINWKSRVSRNATGSIFFLEVNNQTYGIVQIVGADYADRAYDLRHPSSNGHRHVSEVFYAKHPGIWYEPGDIELFLSTECPNLDIARANMQALKDYYERSKDDKYLAPRSPSLFKKGTRFLAQKFTKQKKSEPPFLTQLLPKALHSIIFSYLQTTAEKNAVLMKVDGEHVHQIGFRPLVDGEEVLAIMGMDAHKQIHLLMCVLANRTKTDAEFFAELGEKTENGSIQKRTQEELAPVINITPSTFLVPSLIERFLTNQLTDIFLREHAGICDQDIPLDDIANAVPTTIVPYNTSHDSEQPDNQNTGDGGPPRLAEDEEKS